MSLLHTLNFVTRRVSMCARAIDCLFLFLDLRQFFFRVSMCAGERISVFDFEPVTYIPAKVVTQSVGRPSFACQRRHICFSVICFLLDKKKKRKKNDPQITGRVSAAAAAAAAGTLYLVVRQLQLLRQDRYRPGQYRDIHQTKTKADHVVDMREEQGGSQGEQRGGRGNRRGGREEEHLSFIEHEVIWQASSARVVRPPEL